MSTWIALLRGVGGGIRPLPMRELAAALEGIGLKDVRTYIQSGNVVFSSVKSATRLAGEIERCIEKKFGFHSRTFVLSVGELRRAAAGNPFPQADQAPQTLHLFFLAKLAKAPYGPVLLGVVAAGLIGFGAFSLVESRYRRV